MVDVANLQGQSGQTQGQQQWFTDDILGGEDIFTPVPELEIDEEDLPYGDLLEKKYQFEPIPEDIETPVVAPGEPTIPEVKPVVIPTPVTPEPVAPVVPVPVVPEAEQKREMPPVQPVPVAVPSVPEPEPVAVSWENLLQTDVQKKFGELFFTTKKVYELKEKLNISEESFDILWANNDKICISYKFVLDETDTPSLFIAKNEQNKETDEEIINELKFVFDTQSTSLRVMINDTLLFDEVQDFTEDQKKKLQVVDKINKFMFLASEEVRKLEIIIKQKEEEERERRRLQEIFRNF